MQKHSIGTLAYFDSLYGMIKCKVTAIQGNKITAKVTAEHNGYKVGEVINSKSHSVVPRTSVFQRNYRMMIRNNYIWV